MGIEVDILIIVENTGIHNTEFAASLRKHSALERTFMASGLFQAWHFSNAKKKT
jgi:hypothetical protein